MVLVFVSCKQTTPKNYMILSGKITNKNSDSLIVRSRTYLKKIDVNEDGTFSDTLKLKKGDYYISDSKEQTSVYLKNGFDLQLTLNTNEFDETIIYKGIGSRTNNYLAQKALLQEQVLNDFTIYDLDKNVFDKKITGIFNKIKILLKDLKSEDSIFIAKQNKNIENLNKFVTTNYDDKIYLSTVLAKGKPSPKFLNYENDSGGVTSLNDLKGKYVYIDVWATWCGPCKAEIPSLKEIEVAYHGKNIEFVSISIDNAKDHDKWKKMIIDKELKGVQLFADKDFNSDFVQNYAVRGIPRFILIDPIGNIVSADAPRPSNKELVKLFNSLQI